MSKTVNIYKDGNWIQSVNYFKDVLEMDWYIKHCENLGLTCTVS